MKKLLLFCVVMTGAIISYAQPSTTTTPPKTVTPPKVKQVPNPAAYACPKCFDITKGAGKCAKCQADKVQLGTYFCPSCLKGTGNKPGKCTTCNGSTVQMTRKYCAAHMGKTGKPKEDAKM